MLLKIAILSLFSLTAFAKMEPLDIAYESIGIIEKKGVADDGTACKVHSRFSFYSNPEVEGQPQSYSIGSFAVSIEGFNNDGLFLSRLTPISGGGPTCPEIMKNKDGNFAITNKINPAVCGPLKSGWSFVIEAKSEGKDRHTITDRDGKIRANCTTDF